jgi:hypothetical protein
VWRAGDIPPGKTVGFRQTTLAARPAWRHLTNRLIIRGRPVPAMAARRSRLVDAAVAAVLAALAFAARWPLLGAPVYGDEAVHYAMARRLGGSGGISFFEGGPWTLAHLVAGRPLFALLHAPGAWFGFEGFRVLGAAFSALLPAAAYVLARRLGARPWLAAGAGAAVALHPSLVVWGARVFPDSLMAVFVVAGLAAHAAGRKGLAWLLVVAAVWVKESALGALGGLLVFEAVALARERSAAGTKWGTQGLWRRARPLAALAVAPVPLLVGHALFPLWPGYASGGDVRSALEPLLLSSWLLAPLAAAWAVPRARPAAAAATGLLALYALHAAVRGRLLQGWYAVLPAALALALAAAVVEAGLRSRRWPRLAAPPLAVGLAGLMVLAVAGTTALGALAHPVQPRGEAGLPDTVDAVRREGADAEAMVRFQEARRPATVLEVDVFWHSVDYPLSGTRSTVVAYPVMAPLAPGAAARLGADGESSDLTWVQHWGDTPFEAAFVGTYGDCKVFAAGAWTAYDLAGCQGRSAALAEAYEAALANP